MNDRMIVRRLKKTYPLIHGTIAPDPIVRDMKVLSLYFDRYVEITGVEKKDIICNHRNPLVQWEEERTIFLAVMVMLIDPLFFNYRESPTYRFQKEMTRLLDCKSGQIFYNLRKARNFIKVYPEFKDLVYDIYTKIVK